MLNRTLNLLQKAATVKLYLQRLGPFEGILWFGSSFLKPFPNIVLNYKRVVH